MEFLESLPELFRMTWGQLVAVLSGLAALVTLGYKFFQFMRENHSLERQVADLRRQTSDYVDREGSLRQKLHDLNDAVHSVTGERDTFERLAKERQEKISDITKFDGRLWDRPLRVNPPAFVLPGDRKTRFISVANLKGGVGKTTIAASAGVSLARRGKSVLLVDLDFQGSLTRLCSPPQLVAELIDRNETVQTLLTLGQDAPHDWLRRVSHPVKDLPSGAGKCRFMAAYDELAEVELREEARWFVERDPDVRFIFRRLFHSRAILDEYDYVIFDCPPRLTTACVNALACSDGVVIPVILDQQSAAPLQYMVRALSRLAILNAPSPIGVVANQVQIRNGQPIGRQRDTLKIMNEYLLRNRMGPERVFRSLVPADPGIAVAADEGVVAATDRKTAKLFEPLAKNIEKIFHHESVEHLQLT